MWTVNSDCIIVNYALDWTKGVKKKTDNNIVGSLLEIRLCFFSLVHLWNLFHFTFQKIDKCFMYIEHPANIKSTANEQITNHNETFV